MLDRTFDEAIAIIHKLEEHGYQAYFVGGCVRDLLLNRSISDIDIATSAKPEEVQKLFDNVIPVGLEHGTVIVRHLNKSYEVTTFRIDGTYSDSRRPDNVEFIQTIDGDLNRRDFTINALAMDKSGNIIDLFGGASDIQNKIIRTVGNGYHRFQEDSLRIMRAIRFSSQLGFTIEPKTLDDMVKLSSEIQNVAVERLRVEVQKLFGGAYVNNGIHYLKDSNIYKYLPIMINYPYIMQQFPTKIQPLKGFSEIIVLFHFLEPKIALNKWFSAWKCSNKEKQEILHLVRSISYFIKNGVDAWLIYTLKLSFFDSFIRILNVLNLSYDNLNSEMMKIYQYLPIYSRYELQLNGHDLLALYPDVKTGSWMHEVLEKVEKEVVYGRLLNKNTELKEWIKWNPPEIN